jgi:RNA polymerase sigma factor (sigma-70 family)
MGASIMSNAHCAQVSRPQTRPDAAGPGECDFQRELTALIPQLRAFARSLCRDATRADDLAQDALASAWKARANYRPGTNLRAWVYVILRNRFYSDARRAGRSTSLSPEIAEATLASRDNVETSIVKPWSSWALAGSRTTKPRRCLTSRPEP